MIMPPSDTVRAADPKPSDVTLDETGWLLEFVRDRDVACPSCDYNLRALTRDRCPECGQELRLAIRLAEPRMGAWIALAAAITLSAGVGVFMTYFACALGFRRLLDQISASGFAGLMWFYAALLACPSVFVFRRRIQRLRQGLQVAASIIAWMVTALAFTLFWIGMK